MEGQIITAGTPEFVAKQTNSHTATYLKPKLGLTPTIKSGNWK